MADVTLPPGVAPARAAHSFLGGLALGLLPLAALALGWEAFARSGPLPRSVLPRLSAVLARIYTAAGSGDLAINVSVTLYRALTGFFIAAVGGDEEAGERAIQRDADIDREIAGAGIGVDARS